MCLKDYLKALGNAPKRDSDQPKAMESQQNQGSVKQADSVAQALSPLCTSLLILGL